MADERTDALYASLRRRSGTDARGNGYVSAAFFSREQNFLLSRLKTKRGFRVLDLGCGSGLMLQPAAGVAEVIGVDFNAGAVTQAAANQLVVVRGDAFCLPFIAGSFDAVCCCQFLNQQSLDQQGPLLNEVARVLRPGGACHLMWRNGRSLIHRAVHTTNSLWRRGLGQPVFPQYFHAPDRLIERARLYGLTPGEMKVTLPFGREAVDRQSPLAALVGASFYLELFRDDD